MTKRRNLTKKLQKLAILALCLGVLVAARAEDVEYVNESGIEIHYNESGSVKAIVAIDEEGNSKEFSYEQLVLPDYSYIEMRQMLEFLFKVIPRLVGDERVEGEYSEAIQTWVAARDEHKF